MKKLMTLALLALVTTQSFAGTFGCKKEYDAKFEAMNNRSDLIPVGGLAAGFLVPVTVATLGAGLIITAPIAVAALILNPASWLLQMKHDDKIYAGHSVLLETQYTREDVLKMAQRRFEDAAIFDTKTKLAKLNKGRVRLGLPEITLREYLVQNPLSEFNPEAHMSAIDVFAESLNKRFGTNHSPEEIESKVRELAQDKTFCQKKVLTINKIMEITSKRL